MLNLLCRVVEGTTVLGVPYAQSPVQSSRGHYIDLYIYMFMYIGFGRVWLKLTLPAGVGHSVLGNIHPFHNARRPIFCVV